MTPAEMSEHAQNAKDAIFNEMLAALKIQVQNYWQTPEENARLRNLLERVNRIAGGQ